MQELKKQLQSTGLEVDIAKTNDFVVCRFTKSKPSIGTSLNGLEVRFERKLVTVNKTDKGFYLAFQPN